MRTMIRRRTLACTIVFGFLSLVPADPRAVAAEASAEGRDEGRLVLTERMQVTNFDPRTGQGSQAGTFIASGALNDAGIATATFQIKPGKNGCGVLAGPHTFTGSTGTFTVLTKGVICPFPPPNPPRVFASGTWRVVDAFGGYQGLRGRGTILATADFSTGEITIARDGDVDRDE